MRKLIVGLVAVGFLAVAAPAMAQIPESTGMGDPLGLIASGALIPYVGTGTGAPNSVLSPNSLSFLEVASPVKANSEFHLFYFDASCVKGPKSLALPLTTNDVVVIPASPDPDNPPDGLIAAAGSSLSGQFLEPLQNPIHARVIWINVGLDFARILEPIALDHAEFPLNVLSWSPLRTAATFWAPLEASPFNTSLLLICPNQSITKKAGPLDTTTIFPAPTFPVLINDAVAAGKATPLQGRIYNDEEKFLRNFTTTCNCLVTKAVTALDSVYADANPITGAPNGTYTELESGTQASAPTGPFGFTGYRAIRVSNPQLDIFGRLSNGNLDSIRGSLGAGQLTR